MGNVGVAAMQGAEARAGMWATDFPVPKARTGALEYFATIFWGGFAFGKSRDRLFINQGGRSWRGYLRDASAGESVHQASRFFFNRIAGAFAFALFAAVTAYAALDTSGPQPGAGREWKDDRGQVIKRVDAQGRMTLLTWDAEGHLIKIAGLEGRVDLFRRHAARPRGVGASIPL